MGMDFLALMIWVCTYQARKGGIFTKEIAQKIGWKGVLVYYINII